MLPADVSPSVMKQLQLKGFLQQLEAQKALQMAGPGFEAEKKKILDSLEATRLNENLKNLDATLTEHANEWMNLHGEELLRDAGHQQRLEELTGAIRATRAEMRAAYAKLQSLRGAGSSSNP
ncbi:unnamed protein product [Tilletia controversa]|nr:unnamed protein product [Tilletia controversa]